MLRAETKSTRQRSWVIGLALLSLAVPIVAVFLRQEPIVPFDHPDRMSYYRQTIIALALGIACAGGAFIGNRAPAPAWFRWLSSILAGLGVLISVVLLWGLIGTCGAQVLWGMCTP